MSEPIYTVHALTKTYQDRRILNIECLDVYRGEILVRVGPSGVGKSTLLRMLNFLEPPDSGRIDFCLAERDASFCATINAQHPAPLVLQRRVTTVFQRPILLDRSVQANVAYGLRLRGQRDATHKVTRALDWVGLADLAHQRARTLSGGEAQRVSLARAIVLQPDVLLLDEPTANLDPYNIGLIEEIVRSLNEREGTTIVLVTHNVFQARRLAHRVGLLLEGRIVEVAQGSDFFDAPQDPRTAAFARGEMIY